MQIVISPAKKLNLSHKASNKEYSLPEFTGKANILAKLMRGLSAEDLQKLMKISKNVAELNVTRYQEFSNKSSSTHPALFTFAGEVYNGIQAETLNTENIKYANNHLSILSGLYGILKPLDLIQPYRLEMGTKIKVDDNSNNLYEFWRDNVTSNLKQKLDNDDNILVNLASNEYFNVIDKKKLSAQIITPVFKERRGSDLKTIMVYAKKARGLMARYIIENQINKIDQIKDFNIEDYKFSPLNSKQSKQEIFLTFIR